MGATKMKIGRFFAALVIASFVVTIATMLAPQAVQAQCVPGQVCPPAPGGENEKKKRPTHTPVPTSAAVTPIPILPAAGPVTGGSPNGINPGPISANPGGLGGKDPGPTQSPLLNSPLGLIGIIVVIIVVCFGGALRFFRSRGGLGTIGGAGNRNSLGNENWTTRGGTENFTTTFKDVADKWQKGVPAVQNPGGSENATVTHPDLGGGMEMNTIGGHDIGGKGGGIEMNTIGGHDIGGAGGEL
jgi:hypothetical protein